MQLAFSWTGNIHYTIVSEQIISHEHHLWIRVVSISTAVVTGLSAVPRELLLLRDVRRQGCCRSTTDIYYCWKFLYTVSSGFFIHLSPVLLFEISCCHIQRHCDKDASSLEHICQVMWKKGFSDHIQMCKAQGQAGETVTSWSTPAPCSRGASPQWSCRRRPSDWGRYSVCDGIKRRNFLTLCKTYEKFKAGAKGEEREKSTCLME